MTETEHDTFTASPQDQARWRTGDHLLVVARLLDGDAAIIRSQTSWGSPQVQAAPLAGIRAASFVEYVAAARVKEFARQARAEGITWAEIGAALGLAKAAEDADEDLAEAAWAFIATGRLPQLERYNSWREAVSWKCGTCGSWITDTGPFDAHPSECEHGHDEFCSRHRADLAAFRTWHEQ